MNRLIASTLALTMIALMGTTGTGVAGNYPTMETAGSSAPAVESPDTQSAPGESAEESPDETMDTESVTEEKSGADTSMTEDVDSSTKEDVKSESSTIEDTNDQSSLEQDTDMEYPAEIAEPARQAPDRQSSMSDYGTESIYGTVTLVGDNVIKLQDSATGMGHTIRVSEKQEEELTTGYMIDAKVRNGRLVAFTQMSVPENVEDIVYSAENLS